MLNRNSKKLPKEDITAIKKTGKRLRNGYALTKLKRWKKEYAERKLRSTTATEEPKKTYALKTERMKRAKVTIARRKKSKAMQERREYWRKKNRSVESVGRKTKSTVKSTAKKATPSGRAMPTKQAISKVKVGEKKVSGEKKGVKGKIHAVSSGRAMPTKQAISKVKVGEKKVSGEKKGVKGKIHAVSSGRAMPTKQAISKVKVGEKKVSGEKKGVKGKIHAVSSGRAMPIQNRAMVNKQIVEKIKQIEKPVEIEQIEKPVEIEQIEKPVEIEQIEKPTIKEIAKKSKGKVIVASLPKFTEENVEKVKTLQIEKNNSYVLFYLIYGDNKQFFSGDEAFKFRDWVDHNNDFNKEPNKYDYIKLDIENIVETYALTNNINLDIITTKKYIRLLICWFLYPNVIGAPKNINVLFKHINKKYDVEDLLPIPIYAENVNKKQIKPLNNLNWKTFWDLTKNFRMKDHQNISKIFYDDTDLVTTDSYKLLVISKTILNDETQKKLQKQTVYDENLNNVGVNYIPYINAIPDEDNVITKYIDVEDEINRCKLILKLKKYFTFDFGNLILDKVLYQKNEKLYGIAYNSEYMLDILEFYKKIGVNEVEIFVQNKFDIVDSYVTINHGVEFSKTKKAIIIKPKYNVGHYSFSLLMPVRAEKTIFLDIDNIDIAENLYKDFSLSDNIDYTSEVQEIANDVPAFGDLFSDIDYSNEVQEIANDVPAFGDDIIEEKLILDSEYDLPEVQIKRDDTAIASSKDIRAMKFKQMMLPSKYKTLLGKVPENFRLLLWGAPGHGKSSLALTIANDIGKRIKTLYVSAEESLESATLSSRIKRFKANSRNLMFNDTNNPEIIEKIIMTFNPKFIVIDSVNVMLGKAEAMINLMLKYPNIGFIIIAQATKDRKRYAGLGSLAHAVDIVVNVKDGLATAEKNRYAQLGSMAVKGIKI